MELVNQGDSGPANFRSKLFWWKNDKKRQLQHTSSHYWRWGNFVI